MSEKHVYGFCDGCGVPEHLFGFRMGEMYCRDCPSLRKRLSIVAAEASSPIKPVPLRETFSMLWKTIRGKG